MATAPNPAPRLPRAIALHRASARGQRREPSRRSHRRRTTRPSGPGSARSVACRLVDQPRPPGAEAPPLRPRALRALVVAREEGSARAGARRSRCAAQERARAATALLAPAPGWALARAPREQAVWERLVVAPDRCAAGRR